MEGNEDSRESRAAKYRMYALEAVLRFTPWWPTRVLRLTHGLEDIYGNRLRNGLISIKRV
jgi:hypothetical protein